MEHSAIGIKTDVRSEEDDIKCYSSMRINRNSETELINRGQVRHAEADQFIQNGDINFDKKEYDLDTEKKQEIVFLPELVKGENSDVNRWQLSTKHNSIQDSVVEMYVNNGEIEVKSKADKSNSKDYECQDNALQNKSCKKKRKKNKQIRKKAFCEICSTSFCNKYVLTNHKLHVHGEEEHYKCDQCSFVSSYKVSLINHRKVHKSHSELKMHKCKECEFKTKYKNNLKAHSLARHQDLEVLKLKKDMPTHKTTSEAQIYNCGHCPYKTVDKRHMKYHVMTHKEKSELVTYDCFHCPYKGKRKEHLRRHMLTHKTPRELTTHQSNTQVYSCDKGTLATNNKSSRMNQMNSKLKKFKCKICLYQATSRTKLKQHCFTHPEVKQAPLTTYKCTCCSFQTTYKHYLKTHRLIHKDKNLVELPMFKCLLCSYQSIRKRNFERHVQCHRKSSVTELWKCEICGGKFNKYHVKQHQRTCVAQEDVIRGPYNGGKTKKQSA